MKWTPEQYRARTSARKKRNKYNAKQVEVGGVKFDSKLERAFYLELKRRLIRFEFQKKYTLISGYTYRGKKVRGRKVTIDFFLPEQNILIDTKGVLTEAASLRYALLRKKLSREENPPAFCLVKPGQVMSFFDALNNNELSKFEL